MLHTTLTGKAIIVLLGTLIPSGWLVRDLVIFQQDEKHNQKLMFFLLVYFLYLDPMNRDWHLFDSAKACCEEWFPYNSVECEMNVVKSYNGVSQHHFFKSFFYRRSLLIIRNNIFVKNGSQSDGSSSSSKRWYPTTYPFKCLEVDGNTPAWMQQEGYRQYYIFDSHAECCKAHYCT